MDDAARWACEQLGFTACYVLSPGTALVRGWVLAGRFLRGAAGRRLCDRPPYPLTNGCSHAQPLAAEDPSRSGTKAKLVH